MNFNIMDSHVHSTFSHDGLNKIEEICNKAINKGTKYITFTEHVDYNPLDEGYKFLEVEKYLEKIEKVNKKFGEKIEIFSGVEFSEPHLYPEQLNKYNDYEFDLIMGAIHWVGDIFVGDDELQNRYTFNEIFLKYYNLLYRSVKNNNFDVVAHLDFPKRYLNYEYKNENLMNKILKQIVKNDIVLEINSSSLRKGLSTPMPSEWILKKYIKFGGKRVTIGSDSHRINELTNDFELIYKIVEKLDLIPGYFKKREFIKLNKS
ncbi:MAG: histidinol-phosphatase HisJ family protein [Halanaerobiales bacterium]